jgi:hypothetical protein
MLAGEAGLKVFDLLLDFLFAVAGGKEDVLRVSLLPLEFVAMAFPVVLVVLFIALQQPGEFVIGFTTRQFHVGFMLAQVVIAEEAEFCEPLQRGQGEVKAAIDEVKRVVELDFSSERTAHVFAHGGLRDFTAEDAENAEEMLWGLRGCWGWFCLWLTANGQLRIAESRMLFLNTAIVCLSPGQVNCG